MDHAVTPLLPDGPEYGICPYAVAGAAAQPATSVEATSTAARNIPLGLNKESLSCAEWTTIS
jgi:hypothetical protein